MIAIIFILILIWCKLTLDIFNGQDHFLLFKEKKEEKMKNKLTSESFEIFIPAFI